MCRGFSTNRRHGKHRQYHCNRSENGSKQFMQQPTKYIASDPQRLELVKGARASVASCRNTIGRNVACLTHVLTEGFPKATRCRDTANPLAKTCFCNILECCHRRPSYPSVSSGWIGRCLTWLLATSSDSNLDEVYTIGFRKVCSLLWYKIQGDLGCK